MVGRSFIKLHKNSVKLFPLPVPFSNSHICLVLFIHHFASTINSPQNYFGGFGQTGNFINIIHMIKGCHKLEKTPDPRESLHRWTSPGTTPKLLLQLTQPPPCQLAQCPFIKTAAHQAFNSTAPHMPQNKPAHQCSPSSLALSFQLNLELTLKVQPDSMWFKMTLLHLSLPSQRGLLYSSSGFKAWKQEFSLSSCGKLQVSSCLKSLKIHPKLKCALQREIWEPRSRSFQQGI